MSVARARALALVGVLVVAALILVVLAITKDKQSHSSYAGTTCPASAIKVKTRPLPDPDQIKLNIYNGAGQAGLASAVADEFKNRGFTVVKVQDAAHYGGTAKLTYGPKELAAAAVVNSYFLGAADDGFDIKRYKVAGDDAVDVTIGAGYKQLGTKTEVNQAQAQIGNPSPPPGTCDAG
jgi:hypothetical protein